MALRRLTTAAVAALVLGVSGCGVGSGPDVDVAVGRAPSLEAPAPYPVTVAARPAPMLPEAAPAATPSPRPRVPRAGTGRLVRVKLPAAATGGGRTVRYRLEVEGGLPVDRAEAARTVATVLADPRGWRREQRVRFVPATARQRADITVTIASPALTDRLCAPLRTRGRLSCWNGERAVLNAFRWVHGAVTYPGALASYRTYLVNHEVGHGLGLGHRSCPWRGALAPVMVQQTKSLEGCRPWPWPAQPHR